MVVFLVLVVIIVVGRMRWCEYVVRESVSQSVGCCNE